MYVASGLWVNTSWDARFAVNEVNGCSSFAVVGTKVSLYSAFLASLIAASAQPKAPRIALSSGIPAFTGLGYGTVLL